MFVERRLPEGFTWPDNAKLAVLMTFDTQGAVGLPDPYGERPDLRLSMEHGYEPRVGLYRVLNTLDRHGVKASFPTCGRTVERYPEACAAIVERGHEIAAHGYEHEKVNELPRREEEAIVDRTLAAFQAVLGQIPVGWRSPYYLATVDTVPILVDRGFLWHSDFQNDDLPYFLESGTESILEIPTLVTDWPYYWSDVRSSIQSVRGNPRNIMTLLCDSFDVLLRESRDAPKMLCITLHPQIVGRPDRHIILEGFLEYARQHEGVWWGRCIDVYNHLTDGEPGAGAIRSHPIPDTLAGL